MDFFWNLNGNAITLALSDNTHIANYTVPMTGGQRQPIRLQTHRDGIPELPPAGSAIAYSIKPVRADGVGKFDGPALTSVKDGAWITPGDASGFFTALLPLDTPAIRAEIAYDGNAENDKGEIAATVCEFQYTAPGAAFPVKSRRFSSSIGNWVIRDGDALPDQSEVPYPPANSLLKKTDVLPMAATPQLYLPAHCVGSVALRIEGKSKGANAPIFTTQTHTGTPLYVRNLNNWAVDVDLTCISVWNSRGGALGGGVLISRDTLVFAWHFGGDAASTIGVFQVGDTFRFIGPTNEIVNLFVTSGPVRVGSTDIGLLKVQPAPLRIRPAKLPPSNLATFADLTGAPVLKTDQEEKLLVSDLSAVASTSFTLTAPSDSQRLLFHEAWVTGDSGSPAFLLMDGGLVVLGCAEMMNTGPMLSGYITEIVTEMAAFGSMYAAELQRLPVKQQSVCTWDTIGDKPFIGVSTGGFGTPDVGKLAKYGSSGSLTAAIFAGRLVSLGNYSSDPEAAGLGQIAVNGSNLSTGIEDGLNDVLKVLLVSGVLRVDAYGILYLPNADAKRATLKDWLTSLPTSSAGLSSGDPYLNAGVPTVVP